MSGRHIVVVASLLVTACSNLPPADLDACGDGLVDPDRGEDCDRSSADCGAPGTELACRRLCAVATDCPATATCGLDGACHVPDGQFTRATSQAWTSRFALVGDVNGGGDPELVGIDDVRLDVRVAAAGPAFDQADPIPNLPLFDAPRISDATGDDLADVVVSVGTGIDLLIGDPDTLLAPVFQSTFLLPASGPIKTASPRFTTGGEEQSALLAALRVDQGPGCPVPAGCDILLADDDGIGLPHDLDRLAGERLTWGFRPAPVGDAPIQVTAALVFVDDPSQAGDQSALELFRVRLVAAPPRPAIEALGPVAVPVALGRPRDVALADVDGDGLADLVVTLETSTGADVAIGHGRADGGFEPLAWLRARPVTAPLLPFTRVPTALAWGDLDDDGDAELIGDQVGLALDCVVAVDPIAPDTWNCEYEVLVSVDNPWSRVALGDVNGDQRVDLIAARAVGTTVDVLLGTGQRFSWNDASFTAASTVGGIRIGDFDGNQVDDIALIAASTGQDDRADIAVAFGQLAGRPGVPVRMGAISTPLSVDVFTGGLAARSDTVDDLLIIADRNGERQVSALLGSTSQRMVAPLVPVKEPGFEMDDDVIGLVPAVLPLPTGEGVVLAALVTTVRATADGGGRVEANSVRFLSADDQGVLTETYGGSLGTPAFELFNARWAAVPGADGQPLIGAADLAGRVIVVPMAGCPTGCRPVPVRVLIAVGTGRPAALEALDLDRVGSHDLVAAIVGEGGNPDEILIWRDAAGSPERLAIPAGVAPVAVAAIETTIGAPRLLVVAAQGAIRGTPGAVLVAQPDASGRYGPLVRIEASGSFAEAEPGAVGVAVADVDEDGLEDLIVVTGPEPRTPRSLTIYVQGTVAGGVGLAAAGGT